MAEAYMNKAGAGRWRAYSAGSKPAGAPNPFALETLKANDIPLPDGRDAARSKSWDEFAGDHAPRMNVVVTVCDNAAGETCPVWPMTDGAPPQKLHWSFEDPAAVAGDDSARRAAFQKIFDQIKSRIDAFLQQSS